MEQKYLIDTNVISHLFANKFSDSGKEFVTKTIDESFIISVAVEIEVLTYHDTIENMSIIEEFISFATIIELTREITRTAITLRRNYRKLKLADAIIAATAIVHKLVLVTNNTKDFANIKNLKLVDPHQL